jgi:hypothetical protein
MDINPAAAHKAEITANRKIPAWVMSASVHTILIVILFLVVRPTPRGFSDEGDRPGSIVLAQRNDSEKFEYLDESEDTPVNEAESATSDVAPPKDILEALPPERTIWRHFQRLRLMAN